MNGAAPAFVRFSRDKRGYEHFYLVQSSTNRRGKTRARILFWFRTPPGVKVGRPPFSEEVQRAIEAQNPGVVFDWKQLLSTPIPPPAPEAERWRERRRLEKAEKAARRAMQAADVEEEAGETDAAEPTETAASGDEQESGSAVELSEAPAEDAVPVEVIAGQPQPVSHSGRRRRRRRRGGRRDRSPAPASGTPDPDASAALLPDTAASDPPSSNEED